MRELDGSQSGQSDILEAVVPNSESVLSLAVCGVVLSELEGSQIGQSIILEPVGPVIGRLLHSLEGA